MWGVVELMAAAWAVLACGVWALVVGFGRTARTSASARAWLYAVIWAPVCLLLAALAPGLLGALAGVPDHCLSDGLSHHHHLCLIHPPHASGQHVVWSLPLLLAALWAGVMARAGRVLWRRVALTRALVAVGEPTALGEDVRVVRVDAPLAWTVGWWRPRVVLSVGLLERLSPEALGVVLAHERAHVRRRDPLRGVRDQLVASLLPARVAAPLLSRLALARELACDAEAAREVGGELVVARALVEVARHQLRAPQVGLSITSGDLTARVEALVVPPAPSPGVGVWVAASALVLALGAGPVHMALERALSLLLH